jgi:nicotinate dehydrogenase subunit B
LRAGVDSTGKIVAWDQQVWTWGYSSDVLPTIFMARVAATAGATFFQAPGGGDVGTYSFDNMRLVGNTVPPQLRGTYMRSPGRIATNFAGEQFLDEIAAATGQDPIAFRLRHLANNTDPYTLASIQPRITAVLQAVQQASGWQNRPSPGPDASSNKRVVSGRGIAIVASQRSSYIANVAEVDVDRQTGKVRVKRMHVTVDAGQIVNPDAIKSQIEGATIYSTSRVLKEQVVFDKSKILSTDWVTYPILRFTEIPQEINITLLNQPTLSPAGSFANGGVGSYVNSGIGEPPNTVVPAAVANAFFDATGVRIRQLPLTPVRVRAALKAAGVS